MLFTSEVLTPSSTPITHTAQRLPHAIARTPVRFGSPRSFRAHARHSVQCSRPCEAVLSCVSRLRWSQLRWFPLAATPKPELNRIAQRESEVERHSSDLYAARAPVRVAESTDSCWRLTARRATTLTGRIVTFSSRCHGIITKCHTDRRSRFAMQTPVDLRPGSPMHDASSSAGSTVCARCCLCHTGIRGARTFCKSCNGVPSERMHAAQCG